MKTDLMQIAIRELSNGIVLLCLFGALLPTCQVECQPTCADLRDGIVEIIEDIVGAEVHAPDFVQIRLAPEGQTSRIFRDLQRRSLVNWDSNYEILEVNDCRLEISSETVRVLNEFEYVAQSEQNPWLARPDSTDPVVTIPKRLVRNTKDALMISDGICVGEAIFLEVTSARTGEVTYYKLGFAKTGSLAIDKKWLIAID